MSKRYAVFVHRYSSDYEMWMKDVQFHRSVTLNQIGDDGKPDYNQAFYCLDLESEDQDMVIFGSFIPESAQNEFMRTRIPGLDFNFVQ